MNNEHLLINKFLTSHPEVAIASIEELPTEDITLLIESLTENQGLIVLSQLMPFKAGKVLEKIPKDKAGRFIELMPQRNAEAILRVCEKSISEQILNEVNKEKAKHLRSSLNFKTDQVGAHIDPHSFTLNANMKIEKALILINTSITIIKPHIFVLNEENKLVGYLEVTDVIKNQHNKSIKSLMKTVTYTVFAEMSTKDLQDNWDHSFIDLPVVKIDGEFIGTISRTLLSKIIENKSSNNYTIKAGNALGELYTIGLTSLLGSADANLKL